MFDSASYAQKYFDLANTVTGFAVVQMITFLVALGASDTFKAHIDSAPGWPIVLSGILVAAVVYMSAVIACGLIERRLMGDIGRDITKVIFWTAAGRVFAIATISGFGVFVLFLISKTSS